MNNCSVGQIHKHLPLLLEHNFNFHLLQIVNFGLFDSYIVTGVYDWLANNNGYDIVNKYDVEPEVNVKALEETIENLY